MLNKTERQKQVTEGSKHDSPWLIAVARTVTWSDLNQSASFFDIHTTSFLSLF
jgi:hypothetical protein